MPRVVQALLEGGLIDGSCLTVSGKTVAQAAAEDRALSQDQ